MAVLPLLYLYASPPMSPHRIEREGNECQPPWIGGQIGQSACQWQIRWLDPWLPRSSNSIATERLRGGRAHERAPVEPRVAAWLQGLSAAVVGSGLQRAR